MRAHASELPSALPTPTAELIELIFDPTIFEASLARVGLPPVCARVERTQIRRARDALCELARALESEAQPDARELERLSAAFFSAVPGVIGDGAEPPRLRSRAAVDEKHRLLDALSDAALAAKLEAGCAARAAEAPSARHRPALLHEQLRCELTELQASEPELGVIRRYVEATQPPGAGCELLHAWRVDCATEDERFRRHAALGNRRLLWYGCALSEVAAALQDGLRIAEPPLGPAGRGIHLADCQQVASERARAGGAPAHAVLLLVEAALGAQHEITEGNRALTAAPEGADSVLAVGAQAPRRADDVTVVLDGQPVAVPQGEVIWTGRTSAFDHNEYVVYRESQLRIRFILTLGNWL